MHDRRASDNANRKTAGQYVLSVYAAEGDNEVTLADLWQVVSDGKWIIICSAAILAVIAGLVAFLLTPIYRAEVLMAPVAEDESQHGLAALAGQFGGFASLAGLRINSEAGTTAQAVATLRSRALTESFIREHELVPELLLRPVDESDASSETGVASSAMWDALKQFDAIRTVSEDPETGLITLTIDWIDAKKAASWANELVNAVNSRLRTKAIHQAESNLEFLQAALEGQSEVELRSAVYSLIEAEMKNAMFANVRADYAFEVIDPAVPPEERIKPKRRLIVILGFIGGLILGLLLVFLRNLVARTSRESTRRGVP